MPEPRALWLAAALTLALPASAAPADGALKTAHDALVRGDGIAAEEALKQALAAGVLRPTVAFQTRAEMDGPRVSTVTVTGRLSAPISNSSGSCRVSVFR